MAISRELTQKLKSTESDSEIEEMETEEVNFSKTDNNNPWVNGIKPDKEVDDFFSGFRKYWQEHNKNLSGKLISLDEVSKKSSSELRPKSKNTVKKIENSTRKAKKKGEELKQEKNKIVLNESASTSEWEVSLLNDEIENKDDNFEKMFESLEDKIDKKIKNKYDNLNSTKTKQNSTKTKQNKTVNSETKTKRKKIDLTMKPTSQKQIIDEELLETTRDIEEISNDKSLQGLKNIINTLDAEDNQKQVDLNPDKFIQVKKTSLQTAIPDLSTTDDNEEDNGTQRNLIQEAFEDDDITEEFNQDKVKAIDEETPKDIDLTLPGWGSWAGSGITPNQKKSKRLILKMPPAPPRKDQNKGSLIVNEKAQSKIKPLLVSEVPFPFKTVKDYEAAIRAPIGNTFVPERAYKKLIEPSITTKMGAIIEPITRSSLSGKKSV